MKAIISAQWVHSKCFLNPFQLIFSFLKSLICESPLPSLHTHCGCCSLLLPLKLPPTQLYAHWQESCLANGNSLLPEEPSLRHNGTRQLPAAITLPPGLKLSGSVAKNTAPSCYYYYFSQLQHVLGQYMTIYVEAVYKLGFGQLLLNCGCIKMHFEFKKKMILSKTWNSLFIKWRLYILEVIILFYPRIQ